MAPVRAAPEPVDLHSMEMDKPQFDPGLTEQYTGALRRAINKDGSFNVKRVGGHWRDTAIYLRLVNMNWSNFFLTLFLGYMVVNFLFAIAYYALGPDTLKGVPQAASDFDRFMEGFYFSSHTLTTVGFGSISPNTHSGNLLASFEALLGLLSFAVASGLLYGRFSRPSSKIGFSGNMLIAPYKGGKSLQFRVVNRRENSLMELEVMILMMTVVAVEGRLTRQYKPLKVEREKVFFFPLTWTVVHPITEDSPLWNVTAQELEQSQTEFMILMKAWDETFSQTVHQRQSYRYDELVWNAKFEPAFAINSDGDMEVDVEGVGAMKRL